jgi:acyl carrier protein
MAVARADVEATIRSFLDRIDKAAELAPDTLLYADGIGLDSMETAELSALLEDEFGTDPYSSDEMPQTVGEILAFYDSPAVADA